MAVYNASAMELVPKPPEDAFISFIIDGQLYELTAGDMTQEEAYNALKGAFPDVIILPEDDYPTAA